MFNSARPRVSSTCRSRHSASSTKVALPIGRIDIGGFGSGKTLSGAVEALSTMLEYPGGTGVVARFDWLELKNTTWKTLVDITPKEIIANSVLSPAPMLELINGSIALGYNLKKHEQMTSLNLSWGWMDEVNEDGVSEQNFKQFIGRCRWAGGPQCPQGGPGKVWLTGNPGGKNWVYQRFYAHTEDPGAKKWPNHAGFHATTDENTHNPAWYLTNLEENYDAAWLSRFKAGDFDVFEGQILDTFNPEIHVIDPFNIPPEWPRFRSLDHGLTNPTACCWLASDFDGNLYQYNEYYKRNSIIADNVKAILDISREEEYEWTVIDPSTRQQQQAGGMSERIIEQYRKAGLQCSEGDNDFKAAVTAIRGRLAPGEAHRYPRYHIRAGTNDPAPTFYVMRNCKASIWEYQNWRWKDVRPGSVVKEKELERDNHMCAALRYGMLRAPRTPMPSRAADPYSRFQELIAELKGEPYGGGGELVPAGHWIGTHDPR